eukprot:XP_001696456.1 predicted protein [Chlamydomonas reinhardtii]
MASASPSSLLPPPQLACHAAAAAEPVVEVVSLNSLAYAVTSELGDIFEWCHKDDVEARLVVLSPGCRAGG